MRDDDPVVERLDSLHGSYVGLVNAAVGLDRYDLVAELVSLFEADVRDLAKTG